jgi:opacity protein-like surface antigen
VGGSVGLAARVEIRNLRRFVVAMAVLAGIVPAAMAARADDPTIKIGDLTLSSTLTAGGVASRSMAELGTEPEQLLLSTSLTHELTGANFTVGGGVIGNDVDIDSFSDDPSLQSGDQGGYQAFAQFGIAGFTIGGGYAVQYDETVDAGDPSRHTYSVGASYALDNWTFGLDWARGDYDEVFLDVGDTNSDDTFAFTTSYALRPGIRIKGLLEYSDTQASGDDSEAGALAIGIGTLIKF